MNNLTSFYPILLITFRFSLMLVGCWVIKLGYNLMIRGIKGEFKFSSDYKGIKGALVSSSPGLLFVFLGTVICISAIYVDRPFKKWADGGFETQNEKKSVYKIYFNVNNAKTDSGKFNRTILIDSIKSNTSISDEALEKMAKRIYQWVNTPFDESSKTFVQDLAPTLDTTKKDSTKYKKH